MNIELDAPAEMPAGARAAEITAILARAIVRTLLAPHGTPEAGAATCRKEAVGLGFSANQRVHTTPSQPEPLC